MTTQEIEAMTKDELVIERVERMVAKQGEAARAKWVSIAEEKDAETLRVNLRTHNGLSAYPSPSFDRDCWGD